MTALHLDLLVLKKSPALRSSSSMDVREFKVLYAKSGVKKRKLFADGVLRVRAGPPPTFIATLIGEDGCEVSKRTEKSGVTYSVGDEITFGAFVVQIDEEVQLPATVPTVSAPLISQRMPTQGFKAPRFSNPGAMAPIATKPLPLVTSTNTGKSLQSIRLDSSPTHENDDSFWDVEEQESQSHSTAPPATVLSTAPSSSSSLIRAPAQPSTSLFRNPGMSRNTLPKTASGPVEQDPSLLRTMRPHQITGADFLISRLAGAGADGSAVDAAVIGAILADEVSHSEQGPSLVHCPQPVRNCCSPLLHLQMGVGKTLTSISAMWAFIRRGGCKCLVVCPSSLVDNWLKELRHWLGTRLKPLSLKPGADAAAVINTFAISLPSLYPLMVLSYEVRPYPLLTCSGVQHSLTPCPARSDVPQARRAAEHSPAPGAGGLRRGPPAEEHRRHQDHGRFEVSSAGMHIS